MTKYTTETPTEEMLETLYQRLSANFESKFADLNNRLDSLQGDFDSRLTKVESQFNAIADRLGDFEEISHRIGQMEIAHMAIQRRDSLFSSNQVRQYAPSGARFVERPSDWVRIPLLDQD